MAFNWENEQLDTFFGLWFHKNETFNTIWRVTIWGFILLHYQSEIWHGFSTNENFVVENFHTESYLCLLSSQGLITELDKAFKNFHRKKKSSIVKFGQLTFFLFFLYNVIYLSALLLTRLSSNWSLKVQLMNHMSTLTNILGFKKSPFVQKKIFYFLFYI